MIATTPRGTLNYITNCYIHITGLQEANTNIVMNILPDISDSKSASYSDEPAIGRSFPIKSYSHSENRTISWTAHFMITEENDPQRLLAILRLIEAATYPQDGSPYSPPPICKLRCGSLLGENELCAVLKSYSVKFPTDVAWDEATYLPYKFDVDMSFDVVYDSDSLPGAERIVNFGG